MKPRIELKLFFLFLLSSILPLGMVGFVLFSPLVTGNRVTFLIMLVLITLILVVLVSTWVAGRIVSPIQKLSLAFHQLGLGNLDTRVNIHTRDELENLAGGFNKMAEDLKKLIGTLQQEREVASAEKNKLAVVLSGITDAVIAVDLHQVVVVFNSAAEELTGYTAAEAVGKPVGELVKVFGLEGEIAASVYCPIRNDDFEGVVFSQKNAKLIAKGDKEVYADILTGKIMEGPHVNLGCIIALHDVSKEKKLEEMKLDFVSMAAHELRTPLTSLKGYLSVFIQDSKVGLTPDQQMFLSRMNIAASQLSSLVENLLSVSRIERGIFTVNAAPVDWVGHINKSIEEFQDRAKDKKIQLDFVLPNGPIDKVAVDTLRITEVLSNLLANAIAYTQSGGSVTVFLEQKGNEIVTHVKDTGQGIPKDALPHLFTKFFRVSGPLESGSKGTGLGLYISKSIVELHRGKIWVESEEGHGSTFSFSLPIAKAAQDFVPRAFAN